MWEGGDQEEKWQVDDWASNLAARMPVSSFRVPGSGFCFSSNFSFLIV